MLSIYFNYWRSCLDICPEYQFIFPINLDTLIDFSQKESIEQNKRPSISCCHSDAKHAGVCRSSVGSTITRPSYTIN